MPPIFRSRNGFTLLEMIATLTLIPIMIIAIWGVYDVGLKILASKTNDPGVTTGVKTKVESVFITMGNELRQAVSITSATATGVTFTADLNRDGLNETIQYSWGGVAGNPLNRIGTTTIPVILSVTNNPVTSPVFSYYDLSNTLLGFPVTASNVRVVGITITALDSNISFTLRTKIEARNL